MRPVVIPNLPEWATPEGWRRGLRPEPSGLKPVTDRPPANGAPAQTRHALNGHSQAPVHSCKNLVFAVRNMQHVIGGRLYRGILKSVARVWDPSDIREIALQEKVL